MIDPTTLDIKQLRYFVGVVDAGSITRAAAILHIAQPALSSRLSRIEDELGVKLLVRSIQGVRPTEEGRIFYSAATRILRELGGMAKVVRSRGEHPVGRVNLGCLHSTANMIAVPLISRALSELPDVEIAFVAGQSRDIYRRLIDGELDLAVLFRADSTQQLNGRPLIVEEMFAAVSSAADPFVGRGSIDVFELSKLELILPRASIFSVHEMIESAIRERGPEVRVIAEVDSLPALAELVAQGRAASVLPYAAVNRLAASGHVSLKEVRGANFRRTVELCRPLDGESNSAIDAVEALLTSVIDDLAMNGTWTGIEIRYDGPPRHRADRPRA